MCIRTSECNVLVLYEVSEWIRTQWVFCESCVDAFVMMVDGWCWCFLCVLLLLHCFSFSFFGVLCVSLLTIENIMTVYCSVIKPYFDAVLLTYFLIVLFLIVEFLSSLRSFTRHGTHVWKFFHTVHRHVPCWVFLKYV